MDKNRLHLDPRPKDQAVAVGRLEKRGARRGTGSDAAWIVMTDPDGNEFCVLRATPPQGRPEVDRQRPHRRSLLPSESGAGSGATESDDEGK